MTRFDLRQLRYFVAVAESGSFRAASERLHVSQPPLSRQVAALEQALGVRLFDRNASGVTLTSAGHVALARAETVLREAEALAGAFAGGSGRAHALRIGVTMAVGVADRAKLAKAWARELPEAKLEVAPGASRDLIPALKQGRLDFALVGLPGNTAGLETREVRLSPLLAALPARHALARRRRVSVLDAAGLPLFWNPRAFNPAYHDFCLRQFRALGYRPRIVTVDPGQLQTLERIAAGEGWTISNGASRVQGVSWRPLVEGELLGIRVAAAWRRDDPDARLARLAQAAARVLRPAGPTRRKAGRRA